MILTDERRVYIDGLSYEDLLELWRFAPAGDPWFRGETGRYWAERMKQLRSEPGGNDAHLAAGRAGRKRTHERKEGQNGRAR